MKTVRLTGQARKYIASEAGYLRDRNPRAAAAFLDRMADAKSLLSRFPEAGVERSAPPAPGVRRLVVGDYLVDYVLLNAGVVILAIRHGAQAEPPLAEPDFDYEA